jgi:hypothetical protein
MHLVDDDDAYLRWLAQHPRGYVINCYRDPTPDYLILHRATCETIRGRPARGQTWTCSEYSKVCAEEMPALNAWALDALHTFPKPCELCRP